MMNFTINRLPNLTPENLEEVMAERLAATRNCDTSIPMLWQGLWELPFDVDGQERSALYYIPEGTPQGTALVILNIPEGEETLPFLQKSGWLALADQEGFCLYALLPGEDSWKAPAEEKAYVTTAVAEAKKGQYLLAAFSPYIVGYGAIGALLHPVVMADPLHTAAAVFVDSGDVDAETLKQFETKEYDVPDRFDPAMPPLRVPYRSIPTPFWAINAPGEEPAGALAYWKRAARVGAGQPDAALGTVWQQQTITDYTPDGNIVKVALRREVLDVLNPDTTAAVYAFCKQYYRYGMGPLSNMISRRVDPEDIGTVRRSFLDSNGFKREYLVYVPAAYQDSAEKLPTVVAFHGASQSMRNMMANGLWYEIADREGIVVVYPESLLVPMPGDLSRGSAFAWRPLWNLFSCDPRTDLAYVNELLDRVIAEFPVDEKRIYCTGHSMGCMMSNFLGSDVTGHRFAAIAATSGRLMVREHTATQQIPAFLSVGQFDLWSYRMEDEDSVSDEVDMWLVRNGLATEENVRELRLRPTEAYQTGRWNNSVWKDEDGTPWVRYAWITGKHHVHTYDECLVFWEQWFSRWSIGEDGQRHYV